MQYQGDWGDGRLTLWWTILETVLGAIFCAARDVMGRFVRERRVDTYDLYRAIHRAVGDLSGDPFYVSTSTPLQLVHG